jgi:hypothetical protein
LFDCVKLQVQAGVYASRPWAFELIVMAVPLEQQKLVEEAARQFEELLWKLHVRPARWPYQGTTDAVGGHGGDDPDSGRQATI